LTRPLAETLREVFGRAFRARIIVDTPFDTAIRLSYEALASHVEKMVEEAVAAERADHAKRIETYEACLALDLDRAERAEAELGAVSPIIEEIETYTPMLRAIILDVKFADTIEELCRVYRKAPSSPGVGREEQPLPDSAKIAAINGTGRLTIEEEQVEALARFLVDRKHGAGQFERLKDRTRESWIAEARAILQAAAGAGKK